MTLKDKVKNLSIQEIYQLLSDYPMLIKRPLLNNDTTILVGFDEEKYNHYLMR